MMTSHDDVIEEHKRGMIWQSSEDWCSWVYNGIVKRKRRCTKNIHNESAVQVRFCNDPLQQSWDWGCPRLINGSVVPECRNIHRMIE